MSVIVDTCAWSCFFRRDRSRRDPVALEVERLVRADSIQMLGPIRQELLSGAQPQNRFDQLKEYLRFYPNLSLDEEDDENAAHYYNLCRSRGTQGSGTDLLICAASVRHHLSIFTIDTDFEFYAKILPITLHSFRRRS